jgi:hypothetical protein
MTREQFAAFAKWAKTCDGAASPLDTWDAAIIDSQRAEIARLRNWITNEALRNNTCTYRILGDRCAGCNCAKVTSD